MRPKLNILDPELVEQIKEEALRFAAGPRRAGAQPGGAYLAG